MIQFRRALRLFFLVFGLVVGITTACVAYFARMMIRPPRQRLWATPADLGMPYEDVQFPARDGVRLSGWLIKAKESITAAPKATLILVHGWPWNRLGTAAETIWTDLPGSSPIQLIHLVHALHRAGYQLLMFDLRNHGQSAASIPVTFGLREANDVLGALDFLFERADVEKSKIGVIGFSMGANATLFALPRTDQIRAAVAVQPTSAGLFSSRFATSLMGPFGRVLILPIGWLYQIVSGLRLAAIDPVFAAPGVRNTPILYVQGKGDPWGSVENVNQMVLATPNAVQPLFVESVGRFGGYQYVIDNPNVIDAFFREQLSVDE